MKRLEWGRDPSSFYAEFVVGVGPERRGSRRVILAERWGWTVRRVEVVTPADLGDALPHPDNLARLVLDARLAPAVQDRLRTVAEAEEVRFTVIETEAPAPLAELLPLASWRTQAGLYVRELRREGLTLPAEPKALHDQFRALDLVRGAGGKLAVVPGVLPLVDAVLLTLDPLLRRFAPQRVRVGR